MPKRPGITDLVDREVFRKLTARRDGPAMLFFGAHVAVLVLTGWLVALSLGTWWLPLAWFILGTVLVHLFAPLHECTHYTAFKSRRLNDAVGWLCGLAIILSPTFFRLEHKAHHAHTQNPEDDPELIALPKTFWGYVWYLSTVPYWQGLIHNLSEHARGRFNVVEEKFLNTAEQRRVTFETRLMLGFYGVLALGSVALGSAAVLTFWLIPRLLGEPWMRVIRMAEHVGLPLVPNFLENTRTTRVLWPLRVLNWNMAYHTAHHFAPAVPFHRLPAFHAVIEPEIASIGDGYVAVHGHILVAVRAEERLRAGSAG